MEQGTRTARCGLQKGSCAAPVRQRLHPALGYRSPEEAECFASRQKRALRFAPPFNRSSVASATKGVAATPEGFAKVAAARFLPQAKHARYYWLLLAESHLTRRIFGSMLRRIAALPITSGIGKPWVGADWGDAGGREGV